MRGSILRDARLIGKEGDGATEVTTVGDPDGSLDTKCSGVRSPQPSPAVEAAGRS